MLKCYIYCNCFGKVLQEYLLMIQEFNDIYNIKVFYIMDDPKETVDIEYLKNTDLFIYQHMSNNAFKKEDGAFYCTESIIKLLPVNSIKISIPSCYFDGYFIDGINQNQLPKRLKETKDKNDKLLLCEYFPNYCFNKKLFNMLSSNLPIDILLKNIQSNNFYTKSEIYNCINNSFNRFSEKESNTDIPLTKFILENYRKKRLFNTTNHPSKYIFQYIVKELFNKLNFNININEHIYDIDIMKYAGVVPIFDCTINYLQIPNDFNSNFYVHNHLLESIKDYIIFYKKLFEENGIVEIIK